MKNPQTYEEFLNLTFNEYKELCNTVQSKEDTIKFLNFYKRSIVERNKDNKNIINESIKNNITLREIFEIN